MDFLNKAKDIIEAMSFLSWQRIFQLFVLVMIIGITVASWENRSTIYNSIKVGAKVETNAPLIMTLSSGSLNRIDEAVHSSRLIGGMQVVNVNFKKNTTSTAYFSFNNDAIKVAYSNYIGNKSYDSPLFTNSEATNQRIIDLINGDFGCIQFKDSQQYKEFPAASPDIVKVCSISIPPYYGRFSGYMNIYLTREPSSEELSGIKMVAREISLKIYETDVDRANKS